MIAALNKYWRPLTVDEFWDKMDMPMTNNAISVSCFPEEIINFIWTKKREAFEVWSK